MFRKLKKRIEVDNRDSSLPGKGAIESDSRGPSSPPLYSDAASTLIGTPSVWEESPATPLQTTGQDTREQSHFVVNSPSRRAELEGVNIFELPGAPAHPSQLGRNPQTQSAESASSLSTTSYVEPAPRLATSDHAVSFDSIHLQTSQLGHNPQTQPAESASSLLTASYVDPAPRLVTSEHTVSFDSIYSQIGLLIQRLDACGVGQSRARWLSAQLRSEQSRISTWARDRDVEDINQLVSMLEHLPMATRRTMLELCDKLKRWAVSPERASMNLERPTPSQWNYFKWMIEGYDTLELLRTASHGLLTIVPFLTNRPLGIISPSRHSEEVQQYESASERVESTKPPSTEHSDPKKSPTIQFLYKNCLGALRAVTIMSSQKDTSNVLYSRLVVWGCGLFQPSNSLDVILGKDDVESITLFRSHIVGVLADIAIILDMMLRSWDQIVDPEVNKSLLRLQACFAIVKEFSDAAMDDGPDIPEPTANDGNKRLLDSCLEQLGGLVDCLFDVLPSIDRLRQIWILDLEKRSKELAARMALLATAQIPEAVQPSTPRQGPRPKHDAPETKAHEYLSSMSGHRAKFSDELDFSSQPSELKIWTKGKAVASNSSPPKHSSTPFRRWHKPTSPKDSRQKSLQDIVTMDLELATALRLSLLELQKRQFQEQREDQEVIKQLQEWDREIERLKKWSEAFYSSIGPATSEEETARLYSAFEQLAKIGGIFANAPSGGVSSGGLTKGTFEAKEIEERLQRAASVITLANGKSIDVKLDPTWRSYKQALKTFKKANDDIENLGNNRPRDSAFQREYRGP